MLLKHTTPVQKTQCLTLMSENILVVFTYTPKAQTSCFIYILLYGPDPTIKKSPTHQIIVRLARTLASFARYFQRLKQHDFTKRSPLQTTDGTWENVSKNIGASSAERHPNWVREVFHTFRNALSQHKLKPFTALLPETERKRHNCIKTTEQNQN